MKTIKEYTRIEMLEWLQNHFENDGYTVSLYSKEFLPARVALYASKTESDKIVEEIIVEPTTDKEVTREKFFPNISISNTEIPEKQPIRIQGASPTRFYRYYFPHARIFFAYPDYCVEDEKFLEFKNFCDEKGVGLLKTSKVKIEEIISEQSLIDELCDRLSKARIGNKNLKNILSEHLENTLHYLVYYPESIYQRSALIEKKPGKISQVLIDKLQNLTNIKYSKLLIKLSNNYRGEHRNDFEIVLDNISELWITRLGLKYPEIHMHLEEILMRDNKYRDHFIHQFQVFLTGAFILDQMLNFNNFKKTLNSFEKKYKCKIEDAWLAVSTYHDFNYGLQNFDNWLLRFFSDTLFIDNSETKEKLNILNLDAAMVRESLADMISKMVGVLDLTPDQTSKSSKFFYEKASRDRNHGILSALSLLKLCEIQKHNLKISSNGMLQAALSIACHDEDIWEALCGCKGYLKHNNKCEGGCERKLYNTKKVAIHKQDVYSGNTSTDSKCEFWERNLMGVSIFKKIRFNEYPLIFLLIFCDTIQEEGRVSTFSFIDNNSLDNNDFEIEKADFEIEITNFEMLFNNWAKSGEKLEEFKLYTEEVAKLRLIFLKNGYKLSDNSIIYETSKQKRVKWKILDKNLLFEIGMKEMNEKDFSVRPILKECYLNKINVGERSVEVELIIDGLKEKAKEFLRVSWALEDKRFKVHLSERDTKIFKKIAINGSGGE
jgi:hypothetical protein